MFNVLFYLLVLFLRFLSVDSSVEIFKVRENVNLTLTCHLNFTKIPIRSMNENIILWYKDETQVIGVNSISNNPKNYLLHQVNSDTYQLIILNVQLQSSGLYKCQSFTGKEEHHYQVHVLVPPSRVHLVPSVRLPVIAGTLVSFNCTCEHVYPNPLFQWYKNDQLIQRSIGNETFFSSSSLLTLLLTPADHNHIVRCQVSNEASLESVNTEMKLDVLFKPIITVFLNEKEIQMNNLTIIENTFELVRCRILANPMIVPEIQWLKNEQLILGEHREQLWMNFTNIDKLSCRAKNTIGQTEETIHLNLLYPPKLSMSENLTINQGEKLILTCLINGNPSCEQIHWLYNNQLLRSQSCIASQNRTEYLIENIDRAHAGKYTCEVRNRLDINSNQQLDGIAQVSTDVRVQYAPIIFDTYPKLAVLEDEMITAECFVNAYPKASIQWFSPSGQRLETFIEEKRLNDTIQSSILHLPSNYSTLLGTYRCVAKNHFGIDEISIDFQRPGLPDPPYQLEAKNITHSSFILHWQSGYDGGSEQIFQILLNGTHTDERYTNLNSIRFDDLTERTRYFIRIRSKNEIGMSIHSTDLILQTKDATIRPEDFPSIERVTFTKDSRRIRFQLSPIRSRLTLIDQLCVRYYNLEQISSCIPINSMELLNQGLQINIELTNLRLKLCLINHTDFCSKSVSIPYEIPLVNSSSEWILIVAGGIIGSCIVFGLIGLFVCIHQYKRKHQSKIGSTDTLKTTSEPSHSIPSIRVSDTSSSFYHSMNPTRGFYYLDETTGIYSIQEKKNSLPLDSGMPSITSNNSDSLASQALSSLDFYDRSDGDYLVNGRLSEYVSHRMHLPMHARVSSEEESGFSTPTKSHLGKKLVFEVVV